MSALQMISLAFSVGVIAWIVYYCHDWRKVGEEIPLCERAKLVGESQSLFDPVPRTELRPGQLTPAQIERAYRQSALGLMIGTFFPLSIKHLDEPVWQERARQAALEVLLAAQAYWRDKGEFPESLDQLVPQYLEVVPLDPCDRSGGRLRYRRDSTTNALVWSVGINGTDEGGVLDLDVKIGGSADVGFVLKVTESK